MKISKNSEDELEITNVNNVKMLTSVKNTLHQYVRNVQ